MTGSGTARRTVALLLPLAIAGLTACAESDASAEPASAAPEACLDDVDPTRTGIEGTATWARFCPGEELHTLPAEVPSDALTTHLGLLAGLEVLPPGTPLDERCTEPFGERTYRLQIGFADGTVATVVGDTNPVCPGRLEGGDALVAGPDGLGVYGVVMTAFGQQYADGFEDAEDESPLVCPADPGDPGSVDVDGVSAELDTGFAMGRRSPMTMPLTAVRGILCTWPYGAEEDEPVVRPLSAEEAERVRIGLHAIYPGIVDCMGTPEPTFTAVVEDRTGTRRAVTIQDWVCSTVIRGHQGEFGQGYGTGFPWLDR